MSDLLILDEMQRPARLQKFRGRLAPDGDCLVWTGTKNRSGYGVFTIGRDGLYYTCSPHRVAWMIDRGMMIPPGMEVDHLCSNRACAKPDHLEIVDRAENVARSLMRKRVVSTSPIVRYGPFTIEERKRAGGRVVYLLTRREYRADGSVRPRAKVYQTREDAEAASLCTDSRINPVNDLAASDT